MNGVFLPNSLADHPSLIGIVRLPMANTTTYKMSIPVLYREENGTYYSGSQIVDMCDTITQMEITDGYFTVDKNKITDFYPYTYYVLTDGETEPLILKPQFMPTESRIKCQFALSHSPVERYYIEGYKGDYEGNVYNITNNSQMMLPTASNEGINFLTSNANSLAQDRKNTLVNTVLSSVTSLATGNVGQAITSGISGLQTIQSANARLNDVALTPSSISSFGTPSTRKAFNTNKVRVLKMTIKDNYKNKIEKFCKRFGYKYNNYASVDIKTYKGYLKCSMPNIDGKIDNIYTNEIINILERGIYFD